MAHPTTAELRGITIEIRLPTRNTRSAYFFRARDSNENY